MPKIRVGISACLLGHEVRYNGGHKKSSFCFDHLSQFFDFEPLCPEMAIGLGTPRTPIRLIAKEQEVRAVDTNNNQLDFTEALRQYGDSVSNQMGDQFSGYIFMQRSPSCGIERVKVYTEQGTPVISARGIFAQRLMQLRPNLPVEEAGRLNDPNLREQFITQIYLYHAWKTEVEADLKEGRLIDFHSTHKFLYLAHSPALYKAMGQLLSNLKAAPLKDIADQYLGLMMQALRITSTRRKHANVLSHLQGFLKRVLSPSEKAYLAELIEHYRRGIVPLVVPLTLLKHFVETRDKVSEYLKSQSYFNPYPYELGLRNTI